ncbi:MAG: Ig-like domain-containing protein [Oscillospiraceae bacterium]|nr:Ig-like domain-containing protein [Oscillospiraceae bacterium]
MKNSTARTKWKFKAVIWLMVLSIIATIIPVSSVVAALPQQQSSGVLSAPQNLVVTGASSNTVTLAWDGPVERYDDGVVSFDITVAPVDGEVVTHNNVTSPFTVPNLMFDTLHDFKVYAVQDGTRSVAASTNAWTHMPQAVFSQNFNDLGDPSAWTLWHPIGQPIPIPNNAARILAAPITGVQTPGAAPTGLSAGYITGWRGNAANAAQMRFMTEDDNTFLRFYQVGDINSTMGADFDIRLPEDIRLQPNTSGIVSFQLRLDDSSNRRLFFDVRAVNPQGAQATSARLRFNNDNTVAFYTSNTFGTAPGTNRSTRVLPGDFANTWITVNYIYAMEETSGRIHAQIIMEDGYVVSFGEHFVAMNPNTGPYLRVNFGEQNIGLGTPTVRGNNDLDNLRVYEFVPNDKTAVPANDVSVTAVNIAPQAGLAMNPGQWEQLAASVTPANAWQSNVTWESDTPAVATVDINGRVTGHTEGNATITAKSTQNNDVHASVNVNVFVPTGLPETPGVLSVPRNLTVTAIDGFSATLEWDEPLYSYDNGGLVTYNIYWAASDGFVNAITGIEGTTVTLHNLLARTNHDFFVRAVQSGTRSFPARVSAWTGVDVWDLSTGWYSQAPVGQNFNTATGQHLVVARHHVGAPSVGTYAPGSLNAPNTIFNWRSVVASPHLRLEQDESGVFLRMMDGTGAADAAHNFHSLNGTGTMSFDLRTIDNGTNNGLSLQFRNIANQTIAALNFNAANTITLAGGAQGSLQAGASAFNNFPWETWTAFYIDYDMTVSPSRLTFRIGNHTLGTVTTNTDVSRVLLARNANPRGYTDMRNFSTGIEPGANTPGPANPGRMTSLEIVPPLAGFFVALNNHMTFSAQISPQNAWDREVLWETANPDIATVDHNGRVTGVALGTTQLTARSADNPTIFHTVELTVLDFVPVPLNQGSFDVYVDEFQRVHTLELPMTWPERETYVGTDFVIDNPDIARIVNNGFIEGIAPGETEVRAYRSNELIARVPVTVEHRVVDDFDVIRRSARAIFIPETIDVNEPRVIREIEQVNERAERYLSTMRRDWVPGGGTPGAPEPGIATALWPEVLAVGNALQVTSVTEILIRIRALAEAYSLPGGELYMDPDLFDTIELAMQWYLDNIQRFRLCAGYGLPMLDRVYPPAGHPDATPESIRMNQLIRTQPYLRSLNWWHYDMGFAWHGIPVLLLMYELGMSTELVESYARRIRIYNPNTHRNVASSAAGTPAHNNYKQFFTVIDGILLRDEARVRDMASNFMDHRQFQQRSGLLPVNATTHSSGSFWDGSVIGHNFFADQFSYNLEVNIWASNSSVLLAHATIGGTPVLSGENSLPAFAERQALSYIPALWRGAVMPSLQQRSISREAHQGSDAGVTAILYVYADVMQPETRAQFESSLASWMHHNPQILNNAPLPNYDNLRYIFDNVPHVEHTGITAQNFASRGFYHGEGYAFNVAFNNTNAHTGVLATTNQEGRRAVYMNEGMTYVFLDNDQFQWGHDFFATVDFYRLTGTTVEHRGNDWGWTPTANVGRNPQQDLGGTAILRGDNGDFGTTTFRQRFAGSLLGTRDSDLAANKSWFMMDGHIIAIGTDITGTRNRPVATTMEQRRIHTGEVDSFVMNGMPVGESGSATTTENTWIHLSYEGSAAGIGPSPEGSLANIGFFIPREGQDITIGTTTRTGTWQDNNVGASTDPRTNVFADIFIEHGQAPSGRSFEYIILPNATEADMRAFAERQGSDNPAFTIVEATATLHAVYDHDNAVLMVNNHGTTTVEVTCPATDVIFEVSRETSVIIQTLENGVVHIAIFDPTGMQTNAYVTILDTVGTSTISTDDNITLNEGDDYTRVTATQLTSFQGRRFNTWETRLQLELPVEPPVEFNGTNPVHLSNQLQTRDVVLNTRGNLGIFPHHDPFVIPAGRTLTVETALNIQRGAELIVEGTLVISANGRLNNQGGNQTTVSRITVAPGGRIIIEGWVENVTGSVFTNAGVVEITSSGRMNIRAGVSFCLERCGTLTNSGGILNSNRDAIELTSCTD